jgi:hypothetical protein
LLRGPGYLGHLTPGVRGSQSARTVSDFFAYVADYVKQFGEAFTGPAGSQFVTDTAGQRGQFAFTHTIEGECGIRDHPEIVSGVSETNPLSA